MAETFLSPLIDKLLQLLIEEAKSLKGVHKDIRSLKDELEIIQPFLKDADSKSEVGDISDAMKVWIKQISEEADRIEDIIDEYIHHHHHRHRHHRRHPSGLIGSLHKAGQSIKALKSQYEIASEIRNIKVSLREVKDRGVGFGLRPLELGSSSRATNVERPDPRLRSLFMEEDELVGIDVASKELISRLTEGPSTRSVISLVGQGGIGKTTLARKVYNDEVVNGHFYCHSWITVSQSYNMKTLLRIIARQIKLPGDRINHEEECTMDELISPLRQYLQTKRYVFIFDDVWQKDFWEVIKYALPNNDKGSRIIVTTRNTTVATSCSENSCDLVQELQSWSRKMGWELFCKKAFRYDGCCPPELEQLSSEIISKCHGLPLVISTIAGLLSTKHKVGFEWRKMLNNLNSECRKTDISQILCLSYLDLPYHLQTCYLYFGIFPEDHRIYDNTLYGMWIAEGFIKAREGKTAEEVAEDYLNELIQRNLVAFEVVPGEGRLCYVHDLMHDIILSRTDEKYFVQIWDKNKPRFTEKSRRLSIYGSSENVLETIENNGVRSVFLCNVDCVGLTKSFMVTLFQKFKLLKVVNFEYSPVCILPDEVGSLFHLKFLNLKNTDVKMLPKSIGKLHNLRFLDVRYTPIEELPIEINNLRKLRHLLAYDWDFGRFGGVRGVKIYEGIGCLEDLQTLTLVELQQHPNIAGFIKELEKLSQMRWLDVCQLTAETARGLCASIQKMNHLERLCLQSVDREEVLDVHNIQSSHHDLLSDVLLSGRLQNLPDWISKLQSLRSLVLQYSKMIDDPIQGLKGLLNLENLCLTGAYDGEQLHFEEDGFVKLKKLELSELPRLKMVKIERGALPLLEELDIFGNKRLEEVDSTQHLRNIKHLKVYFNPRGIVR